MTQFLNLIRKYDFQIYSRFFHYGLRSDWTSYLYYFFARYGIVIFFLSFIYLIWKKKIRALLCTLLAMGIAGLVDFIVFIFWRRPEPFITHEDVVIPYLNKNLYVDASSFPSSHTYVAFAIATSVFLYGHKKLGTILFIMALFVAIGRVGSGLHYPSDALGGALLGIASGFFVYFLVHKWERREELNKIKSES